MNANEIENLLIEKLQTLTTAQLIKFMAVGLRNRHTEIDMASYGYIENEVCFGCAATNAILEILEIPDNVYIEETQVKAFMDSEILGTSEYFFNDLRRSGFYISEANLRLESLNELLGKESHFKPIKYSQEMHIPALTDDYTEADLQAYEELANCQ